MMIRRSLILLCLCAYVLAESVVFEEDNGIIILNDANYREAIKRFKNIVVVFYSDYDQRSKNFLYDLPHIARGVKEVKKTVRFGKIDLVRNREMNSVYRMREFPRIYLYQDGESRTYDGLVVHDKVKHWILKRLNPGVKTMKDWSVVEQLNRIGVHVAVGCFDRKGSTAFRAFINAMETIENVDGFATFDQQACEDHGIPKESMKLYTSHFQQFVYKGKRMDEETVKKWIKVYLLPAVFPHETSYLKTVYDRDHGIECQLFYLYGREDGEERELEANGMLASLGEAYRGQIFVITNNVVVNNMLDYYGVRKHELPVVMVVNRENHVPIKYRFEGPLELDALSGWVHEFLLGHVQPFFKTEDPYVEKDGNVTRLVAADFARVYNPRLNWLVQFYVPGCRPCERFDAEFQALAGEYADDPDVMVAKMDMSRNDLEKTVFGDYPTWHLYKAGRGRTYTVFKGEVLTKGAIRSFVEKNKVHYTGDDDAGADNGVGLQGVQVEANTAATDVNLEANREANREAKGQTKFDDDLEEIEQEMERIKEQDEEEL